MLHRIRKIISATPYTVVCEWTNGEIRAVKLENKLKEWAAPNQSIYKKLLDNQIFMSVSVDDESKTLYWPRLLNMKTVAGTPLTTGLDLDPEVLYELSDPF